MSDDIKHALSQVTDGHSLSRETMRDVMHGIMTGQATPAQIGGFLVALRLKGETVDEITAAAEVMRQLATPVALQVSPLVDTCGTGGDGASLFNVSTASAFVVAAGGGYVAKHGNRSISSTSGSADVLEKAGVSLSVAPEQVAKCVETLGVGFMFAPAHHSAMKHAIGPRKELGLRTIFNVLGPLTNPAGAKRQVLGVYDSKLCRPLAEVLQKLGSEHVMVVHAQDGLDEISIAAPTDVAELKNGQVQSYVIQPADLGLAQTDLTGLSVDSAEASLKLIRSAFNSDSDPVSQKAADIIAANAGAALYVAGIADTLIAGVSMAQDALSTGLAHEKFKQLVEMTQCF